MKPARIANKVKDEPFNWITHFQSALEAMRVFRVFLTEEQAYGVVPQFNASECGIVRMRGSTKMSCVYEDRPVGT